MRRKPEARSQKPEEANCQLVWHGRMRADPHPIRFFWLLASGFWLLFLASSCVHRTVGSQSFGLPRAQVSPDASLRATFRQQTVAAFNPLADDARVQALQARLTLNSQDVAARLELAAVYEGYRLYEDATQQYRQALALATGPLAEQAVLGLGRCTRASRRPEQAIPLLEAFSKESPSASAWNELGLLYESTGYVMTAERALREAVALDAQSDRLHNNLGYNLLLQKREPEAEGEFRKTLELNPNSATTRNNLGAALAQRGDLEGALEQFQWAADGATAHNNLAVVLLEMCRYEQSREELVKALAIRRNFAPALENFKLVQERIRNRNQRTENEKVLDSLLDRN